MFNIIQYIIEHTKSQSGDVTRMIETEYKTQADREFALKFFEKYNRLPDTKEVNYA